MSLCTTLARTSLFSSQYPLRSKHLSFFFPLSVPFHSLQLGFERNPRRIRCRNYSSVSDALAFENLESNSVSEPVVLEPADEQAKDTVEQLLTSKNKDSIARLMKMERCSSANQSVNPGRWFPYLDKFRAGDVSLSSAEVLEALEPHIMDSRKDRFRNVVKSRSYGICLVVEGLTDFGNVSAAFRSADALGFQSVHVVNCDSSKRLWNSI